MSVITYSNAGEATAELVWVGSGTSDADYAGKDVKDKIVLATGYGGAAPAGGAEIWRQSRGLLPQ